MVCRIEVRPAALRSLRKVHPQDRKRIEAAILLLSRDPRPPAARVLVGRDGFRVRIGNYTIIYAVRDDVLLVVVVTLGHRSEIYRR